MVQIGIPQVIADVVPNVPTNPSDGLSVCTVTGGVTAGVDPIEADPEDESAGFARRRSYELVEEELIVVAVLESCIND